MSGSWHITSLSDVATVIGRGIAPKYADTGPVVVLNQRCIRNGRVTFDASRRHDSYAKPVPPEKLVQVGDVLVNSTGTGTLGRTATVIELGVSTTVDSHVTIVRSKPGVDSRWLGCALSLAEAEIEAMAEGSTGQTELSRHRLALLQLTVPPLDEQRAIAATLGALDDKIESNRRVIDLSEALADQLFARESKISVALKNVATLTMGSSPPGDTYNELGEGLPFYQGVRDFGRRFPGYRIWTTGAVRLAHQNDTLISVRAPVGELNRSREECCIGRGVAAVASQHPSTLYYSLRASSTNWTPFQQEGTVFGAVNKSDLANVQVPWPCMDTLPGLEASLTTIDDKIQSLSIEIEQIMTLRDTLLPELLSGRIRVTEAWRTTV